jgi:drug/metabolite transporter (DMT)-like permease
MYPLLSLGYVVTAFFAMAFLGEIVTYSRWAGIALVVVGCILIVKS